MTARSQHLGTLAIEPHAPIETWFGIGGRADRLATPDSAEQLAECLDLDPACVVLGDGANLLVDDTGVSNLVVSLRAEAFRSVDIDDATGHVVAGAGAKLPQLITETVRRGLSGLQTLAGIPASVGGAVRMNAGGAFGAIADTLVGVHALDRDGNAFDLGPEDLSLGYRHSGLEHLLITSAEFRLERGDPASLRDELKRCMTYKKSTQPLKDDSAGCVFKNPTLDAPLTLDDEHRFEPGDRVSAGLLLDRAGCKGLTVRGATISEHHANFFVTTPDARARDLIELIGLAQQRVFDAYGVRLRREVVIWSRDPEIHG
ncbi:MAG: UDP-N-acetylmuramate dehydrogenase [Phycisphaerales bacterium JB040]